MHRLIYTSRSITPFPPNLRAILKTAQRSNASLGITGALCFLNGVFCQYLEGDRITLENLYTRLLSDGRHKEVKLLQFRRISKRLFKNWSMALMTWTDETRALFKTSNPTKMFDLYTITAATAAETFEALARSSNWLQLAPPPRKLDPVPIQLSVKAA